MGFFSRLFSRFFTSKENKRMQKLEQLQQESNDQMASLNSMFVEIYHKKLEIWESAKKAAIEGQKVNVLLSLQQYRSLEICFYRIEKQIDQLKKRKAALNKLQQNEDLETDAVDEDFGTEKVATCSLVNKEPDTETYVNIVPSVDSLYQKLMKEIAQEQSDSETDEDASDKTGSSPNETEELSKESSDITPQQIQELEKMLNELYNNASDSPNLQQPEK